MSDKQPEQRPGDEEAGRVEMLLDHGDFATATPWAILALRESLIDGLSRGSTEVQHVGQPLPSARRQIESLEREVQRLSRERDEARRERALAIEESAEMGASLGMIEDERDAARLHRDEYEKAANAAEDAAEKVRRERDDAREALAASEQRGVELEEQVRELRAQLRAGAEGRPANLSGAYLGAADDPRSPLHAIRLDVWAILDQAPAEVAGLRKALVDNQVDGSCYEGECACLVGTIAHVRECSIEDLGIGKCADRPAEQWFLPICPDQDEDTEGAYRTRLAIEWIDQWRESRMALAAALREETPND